MQLMEFSLLWNITQILQMPFSFLPNRVGSCLNSRYSASVVSEILQWLGRFFSIAKQSQDTDGGTNRSTALHPGARLPPGLLLQEPGTDLPFPAPSYWNSSGMSTSMLPWNKAKLYKAGIQEDSSGKKAHRRRSFLFLSSISFPFCKTRRMGKWEKCNSWSITLSMGRNSEVGEKTTLVMCDFFLHVFACLLLRPKLAVNYDTNWRI